MEMLLDDVFCESAAAAAAATAASGEGQGRGNNNGEDVVDDDAGP